MRSVDQETSFEEHLADIHNQLGPFEQVTQLLKSAEN